MQNICDVRTRSGKNRPICIEGYLALSHKKNPRIFDCVAGENRRIFSQKPARPQIGLFFPRERSNSTENAAYL